MDKLLCDLKNLNTEIDELERQIGEEMRTAQSNTVPLTDELSKLKINKREFAQKGDFDSVEMCRRKEANLKFKINAQWNRSSIMKNDLSKLKKKKEHLESQIRLERDRIRKNKEIKSRMDEVIENYRKSHSLKMAAIDSKINPEYVEQWHDWGKDGHGETYEYFFREIQTIDEEEKRIKALKTRSQMDDVIDLYEKTGSLKEASQIAGIGYDSVQYWYTWGAMNIDENNVYFYRKIKAIKESRRQD